MLNDNRSHKEGTTKKGKFAKNFLQEIETVKEFRTNNEERIVFELQTCCTLPQP